MGDINRKDVARDDGDQRQIPSASGVHDADRRLVRGGAEEVPAEAEGVGDERDDQLAGLQQEQELVCQMVGDRDGNERKHEASGAQAEWPSRSAGPPSRQSHEGRANQVGRDECERKPAW